MGCVGLGEEGQKFGQEGLLIGRGGVLRHAKAVREVGIFELRI